MPARAARRGAAQPGRGQGAAGVRAGAGAAQPSRGGRLPGGRILSTMGRTRMYRNGTLEDEGFPVAKVSDYLADPTAVVWFDLCEPTADDLSSISEELGLHPLAVEDAVAEHQRAKLDRYQSHLFVTSYGVKLNQNTGELETDEVDAFVTDRALVTVRRSKGFDIDAVVRRWDDSPDLATCGVGFLLYGLLDYVVDTHFEAVQSLDTEIESLEDQLFDDNPKDKDMQRRTFELRKSLVLLRRVVLPMREVLNSLLRRDLHVVDGEILPYFHDIYDHVLRATEWTESLRDLVTHHPGDASHGPRQPAQRDHEASHQLGRDHRRADRSHRLLRAECAISRFRQSGGLLDLHCGHGWYLLGPVCHLPPQRLAVSQVCAARAACSRCGYHPLGTVRGARCVA